MRTPLLLSALLVLPLAGCDSSDPVSAKPCSLNVSAAAASTAVVYTYTVSTSGTATVSKISYRSAAPVAGNTGLTEVSAGIALPWTAQVTLSSGTAPLLSVTGTATKGTVSARAEGRATGSTTVTVNASDTCSQNAG